MNYIIELYGKTLKPWYIVWQLIAIIIHRKKIRILECHSIVYQKIKP